MASQSHRMYAADSSFSRRLIHLSLGTFQVTVSYDSQAVSSPVTHRNWFLLNFDSSLVLLTEGPCRNSFACLSPIKDPSIFDGLCLSSPWQPSWQFLLRCRKLVQVLRTDIQISSYWHKERSQFSEDVVNAVTRVKMNYGLSCKDCYSYVLQKRKEQRCSGQCGHTRNTPWTTAPTSICWYYWSEEFVIYAVEVGSGGMIYVPSSMTIGLGT
jgi:hypothetical protein